MKRLALAMVAVFLAGDALTAQVTTTSSHYASVGAALTATVSAGGGAIHAEGCSTTACLSLGTLDVGNHAAGSIPAVTIYLGPYNYTATQIVMRAGFHVVGMNNGDTGGSGTTIKATSATTPLIVGPLSGTDVAAQHCGLENLRLTGATSSTADGIFFDTAGIGTGGLGGVWYSQFKNLALDGFGGNVVHIRGGGATGTASQGVNQWLSFYDVTAIRTLGGGSAVRIEGANFQTFFYGGEYDSTYGNSNIDTSATPNVYIGCSGCGSIGTTAEPYIIQFLGGTIQGASNLVQVDAAAQVTFQGMHHEQGYVGYLVSIPSTTYQDMGIEVKNTSFNGNVGRNSGAGYLMNVTASQAMGIRASHNLYPGNGKMPDHYFVNSGSAPINCCDFSANEISNSSNNWPAKPLPTVNTNVSRLGCVDGTQLSTSNIGLALNWGTSPTVNSVRGTDCAGTILFTTGSGSPALGAQIQITFADGTWGTVPACHVMASSGPYLQWAKDGSSSATLLKLDVETTPAASTQYGIDFFCTELPN
jgi:hypothetical protein